MKRRVFILAGTSLLALPPLGGVGLAQDRSNPMPEGLRQSLERDPTAPVLGNPAGDVTLTEFFDYNCSFCGRMVEPIQRLISSDDQLRVVFREWPVFGADSEFAARASLASLQQGKYWQTHSALFRTKGRVSEAATMRAAREVGLDIGRLERDMESEQVLRHISMSHMLAEHMGLVGTPSFIAGDEGAFGEYGLEDLRGMVERARRVKG